MASPPGNLLVQLVSVGMVVGQDFQKATRMVVMLNLWNKY